MESKPTRKWLRMGVLGAALVVNMTTALKAAIPLEAQIVTRPLTPYDLATYKPGVSEVSGGLSTVAVGTPVYLETELNKAVPASDIVSVTWGLTNRPAGSTAVLVSSPLGTNVPVYEPADRLIYQVAGRTLLRPDATGQYTVTAQVTTGTNGSTNLSLTITAGTYMGFHTCFLCHSGGLVAPDMSAWQNTGHAHMFSNGIDGAFGFYSQSCLQCHTVGYDSNTNAVNALNGGFYYQMKQSGWTFPTVLTNGNWESIQTNYPAVAKMANIQCENCHGPGSEHAQGFGDTNRISVTTSSGDCNQCHDDPNYHYKGTEWYASAHAVTTRIPSGSAARAVCVSCHTASGFIGRVNGATTTNVTYDAIGCQACHEPHGKTIPADNPHLVRVMASVTMPDGTVVTNAGTGALCLECHHVRNGSVTNMLAKYPLGQATWIGGSVFGTHDGPQGDMVEGINGYTYGKSIPSSAHRYSVTNLCVGCHMQSVSPGDPAFLQAGGHTWEMGYNVITNGVSNHHDKTTVCAQCHGPITNFDMPVQDYNDDGIIEGVQTEVQHLLDKLSTLLPNTNGVIDGLVKTSLSVKTNWTQSQLEGAYNWMFVNNDGSGGVHNAPYATGLLKASIADLTGVSVAGGLPDAWEIQYFGSTTNPDGAPNANPSGDGLPNWLKYSLGLNPLVAATNYPGGVVLANGKTLINPNDTNSIAIFTAAEVSFSTEQGKTYQLQSVSSWSDGWQNVGSPIEGTGSPFSYVTPTRANVQQFYRVVHNP